MINSGNGNGNGNGNERVASHFVLSLLLYIVLMLLFLRAGGRADRRTGERAKDG
ncbi:hypothetical protein K504DRAFT_458409 [Pleomassaria siparia CBS 279.74]|uniref:Uncharacterized protein n=1 Tax=Pleomassaria siparia CBS 279.74 TaxID=1314801 RepID=A0A6G1K6C4_9PLEO|nr:hypothetical protein K504DRAFT_458409 [Pleomassaria siparia CBS 279.74]